MILECFIESLHIAAGNSDFIKYLPFMTFKVGTVIAKVCNEYV